MKDGNDAFITFYYQINSFANHNCSNDDSEWFDAHRSISHRSISDGSVSCVSVRSISLILCRFLIGVFCNHGWRRESTGSLNMVTF